MHRIRPLRPLGLSLLTVLLSMPVQADVVFSSLGAGDSFLDAAWGLGGSRPQDIGMRFTAGADFDFRSIEMALLGEGALTVQLMTDEGGLPGTVIEAIGVSAPGWSSGLVTATSLLTPSLTAGTTYWVATLIPAGGELVWHWSDAAPSVGLAASFDHNASWFPTSGPPAAFRVNGDAVNQVPEPATLGLLGLAGLIGWRALRAGRRVNGVR